MKLTYWISENLKDSTAYSIRRTTRKEVLAELARLGAKESTYGDAPAWVCGEANYRSFYGPVHKVTVEYTSAFDLLDQCLSEGSVCETNADESLQN